MNAKEILQLINDITSDPQRKEETNVLPIMCGSGKSTAISYLIRQTIENAESTKNGLLIVSDRVDRLDDYMHPYDKELQFYLTQHKDHVCIMTHESIMDAYNTQYYKPVLMMTTQRYFRLSVNEINKYLKWKKGIRPLVVIDEYPELMTLVELDNRKLYECRAALKDYKPDGKSDVLFPELKTVIDLYNDFVSQIRTGECGDQDTLRCFWSWFTDYNLGKNYDLMPKSSKDYKEICNNRKTINSFGGGTYYGDIYTRCRAIRQLQSSYALICQRRYGKDLFDDSMLLLLDNYQLIHDIKAKVIILDGTADLSPEYLPNRYCSENRHDFKRSLSHLHIKLINVPTGKTALKSSKEKQELLLDFVELYLSEILKCDDGISESDWAIFTYKDLEKVFKTRFKTNNVEHFGNLKGKNDFRTARHIFQVGINRYPDEVYYLLYRATNAQRTTKYNNMEEAYNYEENPYNYNFHSDEEHQDNLIMEKKKTDLNQNEVLAQSKAIEAEIKNLKGETRAIMNQLLLAEIEQNLFRGIIRNSDGQDDFTFHLFINIHQYADLIKMMRERYESLKAEIVTVQLPKAAALLKIMNRNESTYAKRLIKWHDEELQVDEEYTPNDMRQKIGISTPVSIQSYQLLLHKTPALRGFLDGERVKRGLYKKKKNWYNLTPEN